MTASDETQIKPKSRYHEETPQAINNHRDGNVEINRQRALATMRRPRANLDPPQYAGTFQSNHDPSSPLLHLVYDGNRSMFAHLLIDTSGSKTFA